MQKYHINLSGEERKELTKQLRSRKASMESKKRAYILLDLDESEGRKLPSLRQIAARRGVSDVTIWKTRKKYCIEGLQSVLGRKTRETPPVPAKVTGEVEAYIIATCCGTPPEGKASWSMQMIADKIVLDGIVESISDETVRRVLKKRRLSRT